MTKIEQATFLDPGAHWVEEFRLSENSVTLLLYPSLRKHIKVQLYFDAIQNLKLHMDFTDIDDFSLPWDVIGIESNLVSGEVWNFYLHCDRAAVSFRSKWPLISRH